MKPLILGLLVILPLGGQAIKNTKHDLSNTGPGARTNSSQTCVFCHTPHGAAAAASQVIIEWNKTTTTTAGFTMYNNTNSPGANLQGVVDATPSGASMACFSCHDGTQAVGNMINLPNDIGALTYTAGGGVNASGVIASGSALIGKDLSNDHPVSITYPSNDAGLVPKATVMGLANSVKLYGSPGSEKVQCTSCHDVHNNTISPFLRVTMNGSALCTTCHVK